MWCVEVVFSEKCRPFIRRMIPLEHPTAKTNRIKDFTYCAEEVNRTPDLLITNQLLYHLSYSGFTPVE